MHCIAIDHYKNASLFSHTQHKSLHNFTLFFFTTHKHCSASEERLTVRVILNKRRRLVSTTMGSCCSSQANADKLAEKNDGEYPTAAARRSKSRPSIESRAPPPTMEEETVVKEVLSVSETTKLDRRFLGNGVEEEEKKDEISEAAEEICSLSESLSTTTTTNVTNDDDEATNHHYHYHGNNARSFNRRSPMKPPPKQRSLSGELIGRRDRVLGAKSPSRRPESSPGRRFVNGTGPVRIVQQRNSDSGRVGARRGLSPAKDPGEASARRSRSPAMRSGPGRSMRSPNRKCVDDDDGLNDESFDNPLVSLECFIFL